MDCNVLISRHVTMGIDGHDIILPPAPPVAGPYRWVQILSGVFFVTVQMCHKVFSAGFNVMQRGTDIGAGIVHVGNPANLALPFIIIGSGSKSEFGAFSVLAENKPIAIACIKKINLNLNCWGPALPSPFPLPTGVVVAMSTNEAGFSWGDFVASGLGLLFDVALQGVINFFGGKIGAKIGGALAGRVSSNIIFGSKEIAGLARNEAAISNAASFIFGDFIVGCPLGYSTNHYGIDGLPWNPQTSTEDHNANEKHPESWYRKNPNKLMSDQNEGTFSNVANSISTPDGTGLAQDSPLRGYEDVEVL